MMYKHANNLLPPAINDLYIENCEVHNYLTRQKHLLHVNKSIWNAKQSKIEVNVSISKFKISSKNYLQ